VKFLANLFSFIFHPLLVVTYMLVILTIINPYSFGHPTLAGNSKLIIIVFFSTFFIPGISVVLMKAMDMVESLQLKNKQERIGPYIITGIFYLWLFINLRQNPNIPFSFKYCVLGATIGLFLAFIINIFSKISMHTTGMGGLLAMTIISVYNFSPATIWFSPTNNLSWEFPSTTILMVVLLIAGLVGTARLLLKAHEPHDVYGGYVVGFMAQFAAFLILM